MDINEILFHAVLEKTQFPSVLEKEGCLLYQVYAAIVPFFFLIKNILEAPSLYWPYDFG